MPVQITHKGDFKNLKKFLKEMSSLDPSSTLNSYGKLGVSLLSSNTPKDTGITAGSWGYEVKIERDSWTIGWTNSEKTYQGDPIVILLQYGHGTGTGGYVQGRDFINPSLRPVFDKLVEDIWKAVQKA